MSTDRRHEEMLARKALHPAVDEDVTVAWETAPWDHGNVFYMFAFRYKIITLSVSNVTTKS